MPTHATILIVEDDAGVREALVNFAARGRWGPHRRHGAGGGGNQAAGDPGGIDVVIANIHLTADPEAREGYTLWQRWNALDPQLRFILMSGDTSSRDLPAIRAGAVRWLTKPFGPAEVLEILRGALGR